MNSEKLSASELDLIYKALENVPYAKLLGIELEEIARGTATLGFEIRDELKQNNGVVHGGAIASLIDTATAFAIMSLLPPGERATTVDHTVNYLRPVTSGRVRAAARVARAGRRIIVATADLFDDGGKLAATALTTYIRV